MPDKNGVRIIDGGLTPDGYAIRAERNGRRGVRIVKWRETDLERENVPDRITYFPRNLPTATRARPAPAQPEYLPHNPAVHSIGIAEALPVLEKLAETHGWSNLQRSKLHIAGNRIINPPANVPAGLDRLRLWVGLGMQPTHYELAAQKLALGGVRLIQTRDENVKRSFGQPDVQVFDQEGLHAFNVEKLFGVTIKIPVTPNPDLFLDTLHGHDQELDARVENTPMWSTRNVLALASLSHRFFEEAPDLITAARQESHVPEIS